MPRLEKEDLLKWFQAGEKPREKWKIGTEHEKFVFQRETFERVGYSGKSGISDLLNKLAHENNWEKILKTEISNEIVNSFKKEMKDIGYL